MLIAYRPKLTVGLIRGKELLRLAELLNAPVLKAAALKYIAVNVNSLAASAVAFIFFLSRKINLVQLIV
jgi:hypothetical protein